jgi:hypothetical protein
MPITTICRCGSRITVGDPFAGKAGRCKRCGVELVIPDGARGIDADTLRLWPIPVTSSAGAASEPPP